MSRRIRRIVTGLTLGCLFAVTASACGGSGAGGPRVSGPVRVLYAGSLVQVMENDLGPVFDQATGASFEGFSGGSTKLAHEIRGGVRQGDVYISADPAVNKQLMGSANGDWVSWYAEFASSPLVIGYNPQSKFAEALQTRPWYEVVSKPGFRLGRTDPKLDPKGALTVQAISKAGKNQHDRSLTKQILANSQVFPEQNLVGRLQAGQLDAAFFYSIETSELDIPTADLGPIHLGAHYTVTVLKGAPNPKGARAFVDYLLTGHGARSILTKHGFDVVDPPRVTGQRDAIPDGLKSALGLR